MITLMASDSRTVKELESYGEPVQLCSLEGKVLGVFTPTEIRPRRKIRTPEEEKEYWAEAERRAADPGEDVPLYAVYERLLSLTTDLELRAALQAKIERAREQSKSI